MRLIIIISWILAIIALPLHAYGSELTRINVASKDTLSQVKISVEGVIKPNVFILDKGGKRLVVDLPQTGYSADFKKSLVKTAAIIRTRHAKKKTGLRIVVDLTKSAQYLDYQYDGRVLTLFIEDGVQRKMAKTPYPRLKPNYFQHLLMPAAQHATKTHRRVSEFPIPRLKTTLRTSNTRIIKAVRKPVIVIDPGHGGRDPGAVGQKKVKEETVTLKAAIELKKQLVSSGKYTVVMTRSTDIYVEHEKRVRIARKAGANLFISIHADSVAGSKTRGASVYTLASRAEGRGQQLVNTQNWILDVDLSQKSAPVSDILVDLAQRKAITRSGQFAEILIPQLKRKTRLLGNTHREAGYYVLLAPDVPAVLLEMGFISNLQDEALLNSAAHRKKLMQGVTSAINVYFKKQTQLQAAN